MVQNVKDLDSLKMYGLSQTEINELKGIKQEGQQEIKKVKHEMKEALETMQEASQHDSDSSDEKQGDIEGN